MASFKDALDIGLDLSSFGLEIKNWRDLSRLGRLAHGGITSFFGKKSASDTGGGEKATVEAEENKMQEGEFLAIIGILSAFYMEGVVPAQPITEYQVPASQMHLFNKVIAQMKPGARKLFMGTIGFRGSPMRKRKVTGYVEHEVNGKKRNDPVTEETSETVNLDGKRINSAITYLATQGAGSEDERVKRVAETLEGYGIFTSQRDAAKELGLKSAEELKRFMGWLDTHTHVVLAIFTLGPKKFEEFIVGPICERHLAAIKAEANLSQKRLLQERFQAALIAESEAVNTQNATHYQSFSRRSWTVVGTIIVFAFVLTTLSRCN